MNNNKAGSTKAIYVPKRIPNKEFHVAKFNTTYNCERFFKECTPPLFVFKEPEEKPEEEEPKPIATKRSKKYERKPVEPPPDVWIMEDSSGGKSCFRDTLEPSQTSRFAFVYENPNGTYSLVLTKEWHVFNPHIKKTGNEPPPVCFFNFSLRN